MSEKIGKEQYLDAKYVIENPNKFDHRDVARAQEFCKGYEAGQHEPNVMYPKHNSTEMINHLLVSALRNLDKEKRHILTKNLVARDSLWNEENENDLQST